MNTKIFDVHTFKTEQTEATYIIKNDTQHVFHINPLKLDQNHSLIFYNNTFLSYVQNINF